MHTFLGRILQYYNIKLIIVYKIVLNLHLLNSIFQYLLKISIQKEKTEIT